MNTIFSGLPNDIIISIIRIENDRSQTEKLRRRYEEVVKQLNRITTYLPHGESIRETINRGGDGFSVFEIWGWDGIRHTLHHDLGGWLNEI